MAHFYLNESLIEVTPGASVELIGAEAKHAVTVSRMRVGETLSIGNGQGLVVTGEIIQADAARLSLRADTVVHTPAPAPRITLAQALAKGDRDELAVQAATELGVDGVVPWSAERSVSRWDAAKAVKGRARWESIVREATKQSIRAWLPHVDELHGTKRLAGRRERIVVLDPTGHMGLTELVLDDRDVMLVVGPEGGVSDQELRLFREAGADVVRLGSEVLRTSTAGPAALAVLNARLGRW